MTEFMIGDLIGVLFMTIGHSKHHLEQFALQFALLSLATCRTLKRSEHGMRHPSGRMYYVLVLSYIMYTTGSRTTQKTQDHSWLAQA